MIEFGMTKKITKNKEALTQERSQIETPAVVDRLQKASRVKLNDLIQLQGNLKSLHEKDYWKFKKQLIENGFTSPFIIWIDHKGKKRLLDGHQRLATLKMMGAEKILVPETYMAIEVFAEDEKRARKILLGLASVVGKMTDESLSEFAIESGLDLKFIEDNISLPFNFGLNELSTGESNSSSSPGTDEEKKTKMLDKFIVPPFSVLDTKQGYWRDRRKFWEDFGLKSEAGRDAQLLSKATERDGYGSGYDTTKGENAWGGSGTSIFDPVLCELAYRWFCPSGGNILDPFAGGSVRGIVAGLLGYNYTGIDLRKEQIQENERQAAGICDVTATPRWICDDSTNLDKNKKIKGNFDLMFSCPPYFNLEVYSEDKRDLSNQNYEKFMLMYRDIIWKAVEKLNDDSFAVWVVGEVREKKGDGRYVNFVGDTIKAFLDAGASYYNEAILLTSIGSLPLRAGKAFSSTRKLGKAHQNVLVFCKGDAKKAATKCGDIEVTIPSEDENGSAEGLNGLEL